MERQIPVAPAEIPAAEFAERRARAAELAGKAGFDGLLVCARGGGTLDRYGDVVYLTNFYTSFPYIPDLSAGWSARAHAFVVLAGDGRALLINDCPDDGRIRLEADAIRTTDFVADGVVAAVRELGLEAGRIGIVGRDTLPLSTYEQLAGSLPGVTWGEGQAILKQLRAVKSPAEIALLKHASAVGSVTIEAMMAAAVPGACHGDVVAAGCKVLLPAGGVFYNSFMTSGRGGEDPLYVRTTFPTWGSRERLADGQWIRLGISGVVGGYYFDLSRSKAIGAQTNREIELFEDAIAIIEAGIAAVRPGATAEEVAHAGLSKQEALGYPNDGVFSGLGHGVGLGWDAPWLAPGDKTVLVPGMVLCLERTIRKDGYLGDFEETVVVTEDGSERITSARLRNW